MSSEEQKGYQLAVHEILQKISHKIVEVDQSYNQKLISSVVRDHYKQALNDLLVSITNQ